MTRSNLPHRKDANHDEIKQAIIDAGWQWEDTYQYGGVLLDGIVNRDGVTVLVEVKQPGKKLTARELNVFDNWRGEKIIAFTGTQSVAQLAEIASRYRIIEHDDIPF